MRQLAQLISRKRKSWSSLNTMYGVLSNNDINPVSGLNNINVLRLEMPNGGISYTVIEIRPVCTTQRITIPASCPLTQALLEAISRIEQWRNVEAHSFKFNLMSLVERRNLTPHDTHP